MIGRKPVKCKPVRDSSVGTIGISEGETDLDFRLTVAKFFMPGATYVPSVVPVEQIDELGEWKCLVTFYGLNGDTFRYLVDAPNEEVSGIFQNLISVRREVQEN
ncbi:MAG: hypothetical protein HQL78_12770 [Magnetococcales bacterium]|nr:hypothetical protein [Magnetococcales bacterium]